MTYSEKLKDSRWQQKRLELLQAADWKCQQPILCSSPDNATLSIHHKLYLRGMEPWEYPDWAYEVLCEKCHSRQQMEMQDAHVALAKYPLLQTACEQINCMEPETAEKVAALFFSISLTPSDFSDKLIPILKSSLSSFEQAVNIGWELRIEAEKQLRKCDDVNA